MGQSNQSMAIATTPSLLLGAWVCLTLAASLGESAPLHEAEVTTLGDEAPLKGDAEEEEQPIKETPIKEKEPAEAEPAEKEEEPAPKKKGTAAPKLSAEAEDEKPIKKKEVEAEPAEKEVLPAAAKKPQNCQMSPWGEFSLCNKKCGGGSQSRERKVLVQSKNGGAACGKLVEARKCNTQTCAVKVNCKTGEWSTFSQCSAPCGGGTQLRTRSVTKQPLNGGSPCPKLSESKACNANACPAKSNCLLSAWSAYTGCTKPCGGGTSKRTRTVQQPAKNGGRACGKLSESRQCNTAACKKDCKVGTWGAFSSCTKKCGGGTRKRTRKVTTPAEGAGAKCGQLSEEAPCNTSPCLKQGDDACQLGQWSQYSLCSKKCGGGTQLRQRQVVKPSANKKPCGLLEESRACNTQACPKKCNVTLWGQWSQCNKACGGGQQQRTRSIQKGSSQQGCPTLEENRTCNTKACAVARNCEVGQWTGFADCSLKCGGGTQTRTRQVMKKPTADGTPCPGLTETQPCNAQACTPPAACKVSTWG